MQKKCQRKCQPAKGQVQQEKPRHVGRRAFSFGFVKETKASNKAYIVSKPEEGSKPTCLVNVQLPRGPDQDRVMSALMAKACEEASLEKKAAGLIQRSAAEGHASTACIKAPLGEDQGTDSKPWRWKRRERERRGLEPGPRQCRARSKSQHRPNPPEPPKPRRAQPAQGTPAQPEQGCFRSNEEKPKPEQGPSQSTGTKEETVSRMQKAQAQRRKMHQSLQRLSRQWSLSQNEQPAQGQNEQPKKGHDAAHDGADDKGTLDF